MSGLTIQGYVDDILAHARREDRPDPQPWFRRQERDTPRPTADYLRDRWRALLRERGIQR